ncbi:TetR/AcrR family transcriptional regulator [Cryptosporangium phraense]|uniref:TetR/AcrR family transcriptional regulator n=1 Tax=Cryptosporangium phraense TaxID=2593070 RepID=A0A545AWX8_9ACTN|nr:TetR/AcrR family transcriptional regulator [Cryptosporangium phraense]TQS45828.1 TetR/AcrR family transcriptional regulator [Cryptosporangium phraense]
MPPRRERADAARNRVAILRATESLLARQRPEAISMELVAAEAGVGKGTVFHRFGSRMGLMVALMQERALALREAVDGGPPPLGPGAPPADRLEAFLDAVVDVVARNKNLLAALGHAEAVAPHDEATLAEHPVYVFWHGHVAELLTAAGQPTAGANAGTVAHLLLAPLRSGAVLDLLEADRAGDVKAGLRALARGALAGH